MADLFDDDLDIRFLRISGSEYELGNIMQSGKYAQVRECRDVETNKYYALKILYVDGDRQEVRVMREQMKSELKTLKKLSTNKDMKNIVRLHAFDVRNVSIAAKGGPPRKAYVSVLEHCSNGELYDYVQYNGRFSENLARTVFHQIMNGLANCHRNDIVHRDIKPDNVLFDANYTAKLCGFGFAKTSRSDEGERRRMNTVCGTMGYMAPEMLLNKSYGPKADIFSAGIVLFILLAGYPPLQKAQKGDWWFDRLVEGRYARFWQAHEQNGDKFSVEAKKLIIGMLTPKPEDRYTVEEVRRSAWFTNPVMKDREFRQEMSKMTQRIVQRKNQKQGSNLEGFCASVKKRGAGFRPVLQDLVQNRYVEGLRGAHDQESLQKVLQNIQQNCELSVHLLQALGTSMDDHVECVSTLIEAGETGEVDALKKILPYTRSEDWQNIVKELVPLRNSELDFALSPMNYEIDGLCELFYVDIPQFDPSTLMPINTYKLSCGFDILNFAIRFLIKTKCGEGSMSINAEEATTEIECDASGKERCGAGAQVEGKVKGFKMQIRCFQEPKTGYLVACCTQLGDKDERRAFYSSFTEHVNYLFSQTVLAAFLAQKLKFAEVEKEKEASVR